MRCEKGSQINVEYEKCSQISVEYKMALPPSSY